MSAYIVSKVHIDALVSAGLHHAWYSYGELKWFDSDEPSEGCFEEGQPWGPESLRWAEEHRRMLTDETAGQVGAMLWAENRRSVNHRYAEDEWEEPYVFEMLPGEPDALVVLRAIACYEYQSCEHPQWQTSEAKRFCRALQERAIRHLPGWDDCSGAVNDRDVFLDIDLPGQ